MQILVACLVLIAALSSSLQAYAEPAEKFPSQPIRIVVPFAPGGVTDVVARILGNKLSDQWKIVVENKPGAGGVTGSQAVAQAPADGYTLLSNGAGQSINAIMNPNTPLDVRKDLKPVSLIAVGAGVLVVHPSVPAKTIPEFVSWLKANPGKVSFGSPGRGTTAHLYGEVFKLKAGAEAVHIPYGGTGPMLNDLLAGRIQFAIDNIAAPLAHIKAGTIIALGVTGDERFPDLPDVPLIKDTVKDFEVGGTWNGLFAPAGVPEEILRKIASQVQQAVASPDVSTRIKEFSLKPVGNTPAEFDAYFKRDYELWTEVVKAAGLAPN